MKLQDFTAFTQLNRKTDNSTIIVRDLKTFFQQLAKRQKISKDKEDLNTIITFI